MSNDFYFMLTGPNQTKFSCNKKTEKPNLHIKSLQNEIKKKIYKIDKRMIIYIN